MSRNKREGGYCGKAKNYNTGGNMLVKHWRKGLSAVDTLKETRKYLKWMYSFY